MNSGGNSFVTFISAAALLNMQTPPRVYASKVTLLGSACLQYSTVQVQFKVTKSRREKKS